MCILLSPLHLTQKHTQTIKYVVHEMINHFDHSVKFHIKFYQSQF